MIDPNGPSVQQNISASNATLRGKYFTKSGGYAFSYGSAGFSVNFTGSEFWMYVPTVPKDGVNAVPVNVAVLVDTDMPMKATMVTVNKAGWYRLASGLSSGTHQITVRKAARGIYALATADWFCVTKIGLASGGQVKTPDKLSDLVIEVYGDSISNGDGVWPTNSAYTYGAYGGVIERLLGAEVRICGNSGNGLLGWIKAEKNGKPDNLYPPQDSWSVIDPYAANTAYSHKGANAADVVIINLGTNDRADFNNGDITPKMFHDEYLKFIRQIRKDCPDAIVICTLGAMGGINEFGATIQQVVKDANAELGNGKTFCYWHQLTECTSLRGGGAGYDGGHPSNASHEIYGLQLANIINNALNLGRTLPKSSPNGTQVLSIPGVQLGILPETSELSRLAGHAA